MTTLNYYSLVSFFVTFGCCLYIPTKLSQIDNLIGSFLTSILGVFLWPFAVSAAIRHFKNRSPL